MMGVEKEKGNLQAQIRFGLLGRNDMKTSRLSFIVLWIGSFFLKASLSMYRVC